MSERHTLERQVTPPVALVDPTGATDALSDHLERVFGREGVVRVDDLADAFEALEAHPVSCMLVAFDDVPTPVWRRLVTRAPCPVIAITDVDQQDGAIAAGATDVLDPNAPLAVVRQRVQTVVGAARRGTEGVLPTAAPKPSVDELLERGPIAGIGLEASTGLITGATPAVEPVLGFTPMELDGAEGISLIHPDDRADFRALIESDEDLLAMTVRLEHRDGGWQQHTITVIDGVAASDHETAAQIFLILGPVPDTIKDQTTEAGDSVPSPEPVEFPLASVLEGLEIGVVVFDPDTLLVHEVNDVCARRFGWTSRGDSTSLEEFLDERTQTRVESRVGADGVQRPTPFAATLRGTDGMQTVRATVLSLDPDRAVLCCLAETRAASDTALVSRLSHTWQRLDRGHVSTPSGLGDILASAVFDILPASAVGCYVRDNEQLIGTTILPGDMQPAVSLPTLSLEDVPALDPRTLSGPAMGRVDTESFDPLFAAGFHSGDLYLLPVGDRLLIFAVGIGLRTLDTVDVDASRWLGAAGSQRLESAEAVHQTVRLERTIETRSQERRRIDDLGTAFSTAAMAIPTTDRSAVEEAWCDSLASLEWIDGVWLGTVDPSSERTTARARAGDTLDPSLVSFGDDDPDDPDDPVASVMTVSDPENGRSGSAPGTSMHRLTLAFDGRQFGTLLLTVQAAAVSPALERALERAGETVSLAYALEECQGFLGDGERVALTFAFARRDVTDVDEAGEPLLELACGLEAELEVVSATTEPRRVVVNVREPEMNAATVTETARKSPSFTEAVATERADGGVQLELLMSPEAADQSLQTLLNTYGGRLDWIDATGSRPHLAFELPANTDVRALVTRLERHVPTLELRSKRPIEATTSHTAVGSGDGNTALTERQLETLRVAYRAGYFSWPREQTGAEVAAILGVSQPTFARHLRTAERKLIQGLFDDLDGA